MEGSEGGLLASEPVPPRLPGLLGQWLPHGVRRAFARSQWRARAGLAPASPSTDPWIFGGGKLQEMPTGRRPSAAAVTRLASVKRSRELGANPRLTRNGDGQWRRKPASRPSPNARRLTHT